MIWIAVAQLAGRIYCKVYDWQRVIGQGWIDIFEHESK